MRSTPLDLPDHTSHGRRTSIKDAWRMWGCGVGGCDRECARQGVDAGAGEWTKNLGLAMMTTGTTR